MINTVSELLSQKTIDQYKIIESKYLILKRYLRLYVDNHTLLNKEDIDIIIKSLDSIEEENGIEKKEVMTYQQNNFNR